MAEKQGWRWPFAWLLLGLGLVLSSGPVGDWYAFLRQRLWFGLAFVEGLPFGLDRAPGWLALIGGWCCIARGLGGARKPPSDVPVAFTRIPFQLRWLPVPILGTLGTYAALAYHHVSPLVLTIDVENVPPGVALQGGAIVGSIHWHWSRYGATFDYLFGVDPPPSARTSFSSPHSEFRFAAGGFSLENWQPELERMFVGIEDELQRKAALVLLDVDSSLQDARTIRVTRESLKACRVRTGRGACLSQVAPLSFRERQVRVVFDLAGIELEPYKDPPFYRLPEYR